MAPPRTAANVYIWHDDGEYKDHGAVSRFYFTEELPATTFRYIIQPMLVDVEGVLGVRSHKHYIVVQWSSKLHLGEHLETLDRIEGTTLDALSRVFGWADPTVEQVLTYNEVLEVGQWLGVNWRKGQL